MLLPALPAAGAAGPLVTDSSGLTTACLLPTPLLPPSQLAAPTLRAASLVTPPRALLPAPPRASLLPALRSAPDRRLALAERLSLAAAASEAPLPPPLHAALPAPLPRDLQWPPRPEGGTPSAAANSVWLCCCTAYRRSYRLSSMSSLVHTGHCCSAKVSFHWVSHYTESLLTNNTSVRRQPPRSSIQGRATAPALTAPKIPTASWSDGDTIHLRGAPVRRQAVAAVDVGARAQVGAQLRHHLLQGLPVALRPPPGAHAQQLGRLVVAAQLPDGLRMWQIL